jgi:hypothetical protein
MLLARGLVRPLDRADRGHARNVHDPRARVCRVEDRTDAVDVDRDLPRPLTGLVPDHAGEVEDELAAGGSSPHSLVVGDVPS